MAIYKLSRGAALLLVCLLLSGCVALGYIASKLPKYVDARYQGLQNQTVGVMVWVPTATRIDFPSLQVDLASAVQKKLGDLAVEKDGAKELKGARFPVLPQSIVRYQVDHPEIDGMPVGDVAPRLGVSRLIYIEVEQFATRAAAVELFRGVVSATVRVVEVNNGQAKIVYEENNVSSVFPKKTPEEGVPGAEEYRIYLGSVDDFSTNVVNRFYRHEEEEK